MIEYDHFLLEPGVPCRGRRPEGPYVACVGGAQTFGCYAPDPYPALLGRALNTDSLNLGYGGAGPGFHLRREAAWPHISLAKLVVVQVMSGRSEGNSLFECWGENWGEYRGWGMTPLEFWDTAFRDGLDVAGLAAETRENYVRNMISLVKQVPAPVVLLWFSTRTPEYRPGPGVEGLWGGFPHLVDRSVVGRIAPHCRGYVECVSSRGLPQRLRGRPGRGFLSTFYPARVAGGDPGYNSYYPSPQMHAEAAALLAAPCRRLLSHRVL